MSAHSADVTGPAKKLAGSPAEKLPDPFREDPGMAGFTSSVLEAISLVAIVVDARGTIRLFNRKAAEISGYAREEALGRDISTLLLLGEVQDLPLVRLLHDAGESFQMSGVKLPVRTKDGYKVLLRWDLSVVYDDSGLKAGVACIGQAAADGYQASATQAAVPNVPCSRSQDLVHDILNHNQVAIGYLELAMERKEQAEECQFLLDKAFKALLRSSNLALDVYRKSRDGPGTCVYVAEASLRKGK